MTEILIAMKRDKLVRFANEILANCLKSEDQGGGVEGVELYGVNGDTGKNITIRIDNEDMERDEVDDLAVYVEID